MKKYFFVFSLLFIFAFAPNLVLAVTLGPNNPTSAVNDTSEGAGTISWSTIGSSFVVDGTSSASLSLSSTRTSKFIKLTGFGFSIPTDATINGITLNLVKRGTAADVLVDATVSLVNSSATTTSKASTDFWGTTFGSKSYGSSSDNWGRTWTPNEINDPNFGVIVSVNNSDPVSSRTAHIDGVEISVDYTEAVVLPPPPPPDPLPPPPPTPDPEPVVEPAPVVENNINRSGGRHHDAASGEVLGAFISTEISSDSNSAELQKQFLLIITDYLKLLEAYKNVIK